jgi:hypothetical protein
MSPQHFPTDSQSIVYLQSSKFTFAPEQHHVGSKCIPFNRIPFDYSTSTPTPTSSIADAIDGNPVTAPNLARA